MRTLILTILTLLILTSLTKIDVKAQGQDPITEYDGIPLIIYPERDADVMTDSNFIQMKQMEVFGVLGANALPDNLSGFQEQGLKVLPWWSDSSTFNYIYNYTDAHYTVWEAEGTEPSKGNAELLRSSDTYILSGYVVAEGGVTEPGQVIWGPGYPQNITYRTSSNYVPYTVEYKMKIELRSPPPEGYLDNVVCTLLVTASNTAVTEDTTIVSRILTVDDFNGWNNDTTFSLNYELTGLAQEYLQRIDGMHPTSSQFNSFCMQFKVMWTGLYYLKLYIDKIRVYDDKGLELVEEPGPTSLITGLVNTYISDSTIIGWYGMDEPPSIDNYEPFRIVDSIINARSYGELRLHAGFTGGNSGTFSNWIVIDTMALKLYRDEEFWLRAKPKNVQLNLYNYHYPYVSQPGIPETEYDPEWKDLNIKYVTDTYLKRLNALSIPFTFSTQAGKFGPGVPGESIMPSPEQINYHVNIGLMYGAKELRLDPFFSNGFGNIGLIDPLEQPTENYYFFKYTLVPRLNGWFGKTLKQIHQTEQYPKISGGQNYNFIENFTGNLECLPTTANYDLGFFTDIEARDYFMIVSRWYNEEGVCPIYANLVENYFGFDNLSLTRYIADTTYTVLDDASILISLDPGDAELFRIVPVVKYGGKLIADETLDEGITLNGDMIVEAGVTLTVNADYHCYGNITLNGGNIAGGGKIIFYDNKRLIVNGDSQIFGSSYIIEIDFIAPDTLNGIQVNAGSDFEIYNCIIRNSRYGINAASNTIRLNVMNVDFYNCSDAGINIIGPSSVPFILYYSFNDLDCGISANNLGSIIIQSNTFNGNDLGISMVNVTHPYIFFNSFASGKNTMPGIFLESCNGLIYRNEISGHSNGIVLGNSSPAIGMNTISNNLYHGIYIGTGSLPIMSGQVFDESPEYYAVSGYNTIIENGNNTSGGPWDNDGSEIYINTNANIMMDGGCNSIIDDRVVSGGETPPYETIFLMNGSLRGIPIKIKARYNFWGNHPLYHLEERFGNLFVAFEPYYNEPCQVEEIPGEELLITSSTGEVIDTLHPLNREVGMLSGTELLYASADKKFLTADYEGAEVIYNQIINGSDSLYAKLKAYNRLYEIGKLNSKPLTYFENLYNDYTLHSNATEDSLMKKIFSQLGSLSLVGREDYLPAIEEFDNVILQNPGTEEALFAEIDALTTALLLEEGDTTLGKIAAGKYLLSSNEYGNRIGELLQLNFGSKQKTDELVTAPTDYKLYQNFPNPFNPVTTIKYDLVEAQDVRLIIYDILGREITTLVKSQQQPGSYQVYWNATGVASGIYFYQLRTKDFVNTKKMILLR